MDRMSAGVAADWWSQGSEMQHRLAGIVQRPGDFSTQTHTHICKYTANIKPAVSEI